MTRPGAVAVVAVIFVAGVAVGVLGSQLWPDLGRHLHDHVGVLFHGRGHAHTDGHLHPHIAVDDPRHIDMLAARLGLDEEQKTAVAEILTDAREEAGRLHEQLAPAVHDHIRETRERVAAVLTDEQNRELDELTDEHRGDLERMFLTPGRH